MDFVAIDFETANHRGDSVCSIGMSRFSNGREVERYYRLINPVQPFHPGNIRIHGIYPSDVVNEKRFDQLYPEIRAFIGEDPLVAHFAQFDMKCLQMTIETYNLPKMENEYFCSCILAKKTLTLSSNKLVNVLDYYGLTIENHHNAADDATACGEITSKLLQPYDYDIKGFLTEYHYQLGQLFSHRFGLDKKKKKKVARPNVQNMESLQPSHPFYQKHIAFAGRIAGLNRQEAAQMLTTIGSFFEPSLTYQTDYLIVSKSEWQKMGTTLEGKLVEKARQLQGQGHNLILLPETEFFTIL